MTDPRPVLLDTNAIILLANRLPMAPAALTIVRTATEARSLFVSPVSAWEVGNISRPRNTRRAVDFLPDPTTWFRDFLAGPGVGLTPLTPEIAIAAAYLPEGLNADPADRLLTATARALGAVFVTRNRDILAYAADGHLDAIAC